MANTPRYSLPLPPELLIEIFPHLANKDQWSFARTSRIAYDVARKHYLFRFVQCGATDKSLFDRNARSFNPNEHLNGEPFGWIPNCMKRKTVRRRNEILSPSRSTDIVNPYLTMQDGLDSDKKMIESLGIGHLIRYLDIGIVSYSLFIHGEAFKQALTAATNAYGVCINAKREPVIASELSNLLVTLKACLSPTVRDLGLHVMVYRIGRGFADVENETLSLPENLTTLKLEILSVSHAPRPSSAISIDSNDGLVEKILACPEANTIRSLELTYKSDRKYNEFAPLGRDPQLEQFGHLKLRNFCFNTNRTVRWTDAMLETVCSQWEDLECLSLILDNGDLFWKLTVSESQHKPITYTHFAKLKNCKQLMINMIFKEGELERRDDIDYFVVKLVDRRFEETQRLAMEMPKLERVCWKRKVGNRFDKFDFEKNFAFNVIRTVDENNNNHVVIGPAFDEELNETLERASSAEYIL